MTYKSMVAFLVSCLLPMGVCAQKFPSVKGTTTLIEVERAVEQAVVEAMWSASRGSLAGMREVGALNSAGNYQGVAQKYGAQSIGTAVPDWENLRAFSSEQKQLQQNMKHFIGDIKGSIWRENRSMSHLVVLDAVTGGLTKEWQNVAHITRVLDAFKKLCQETPLTPKNVTYLTQLHHFLLQAKGIREYLPKSKLSRADFDQLTLEELTYLQGRVEEFANMDVKGWMKH